MTSPAMLACYLGVAVADRVTKLLALRALAPGASVRLTSFLSATLVFNRGAAFGLGAGLTPLLVALRAAVAVGAFFAARHFSGLGRIALVGIGLIGGGAFGNLLDYLLYGQVVDFIDLGWFPVFNLADSGIVVGGILLAAGLLAGGGKPEPAGG
jgi:signal peptidase II